MIRLHNSSRNTLITVRSAAFRIVGPADEVVDGYFEIVGKGDERIIGRFALAQLIMKQNVKAIRKILIKTALKFIFARVGIFVALLAFFEVI